MNWLKNNKKLALVVLLATSFSTLMVGMDNVPMAGATNSWLIYEEGKDQEKGTSVSANVLALSGTMNNLLEDFDVEGRAISLPFFQDVISKVFSLLTKSLQKNGLQQIEASIEDYTLSHLVPIANCLDYLACPADIQDIVLSQIREVIGSQNIISNNDLVALNPDLQKLIMVNPSIDYLKDLIIDKEMDNRKKILPSLSAVTSVAFCPDNKEIISGSSRGARTSNSLIWWNGITGDKLKALPLFQKIQSIAISPDGTKILVGCNEDEDDDQNSLTIWDRATAKQIMVFPTNQSIRTVAWSPDGTKVVSGGQLNNGELSTQDNLIVWDAQTGEKLINLPAGKPVLAVAWNPDGRTIASGCHAEENNLIIWDIQDSNAIKQQNLLGDSMAVIAVAWNHDGTKLASGGAADEKKLKIWDFTHNNPVEIESLAGHSKAILTVAWSPDGKRLASGSEVGGDNLIMWMFNNDGTITHKNLTGIKHHVNSIVFNKIGTLMAAGSDYTNIMDEGHRIMWNNSLIVWTLLTEQEYAALNEIHNCNVAHVRLIYQLCLAHAGGSPVKLVKESPELALFATLPKSIKVLLKKYVLSH